MHSKRKSKLLINPLNPIVQYWLHHTAHCRGRWLGHPQDDMSMVASGLGFEKAMVGTGRTTHCPDCMDRFRKHYSHLAEGWFLARLLGL